MAEITPYICLLSGDLNNTLLSSRRISMRGVYLIFCCEASYERRGLKTYLVQCICSPCRFSRSRKLDRKFNKRIA